MKKKYSLAFSLLRVPIKISVLLVLVLSGWLNLKSRSHRVPYNGVKIVQITASSNTKILESERKKTTTHLDELPFASIVRTKSSIYFLKKKGESSSNDKISTKNSTLPSQRNKTIFASQKNKTILSGASLNKKFLMAREEKLGHTNFVGPLLPSASSKKYLAIKVGTFNYINEFTNSNQVKNLKQGLNINHNSRILSLQHKNLLRNTFDNFALNNNFEWQSFNDSKSWLRDDVITLTNIRNVKYGQKACCITWFDANRLSQSSQSFLNETFFADYNLLQKYKNTNYNLLSSVMNDYIVKLKENGQNFRDSKIRFLVDESVVGVLDIAPHRVKKARVDKTYRSDYKEALHWIKRQTKLGGVDHPQWGKDCSKWESNEFDLFILKKLINLQKNN